MKNQTLLFTLHGHYGPVTCVFIDRSDPSFAGSGSQDGLLCVWDLHTGNPVGFFFAFLLFIFIDSSVFNVFASNMLVNLQLSFDCVNISPGFWLVRLRSLMIGNYWISSSVIRVNYVKNSNALNFAKKKVLCENELVQNLSKFCECAFTVVAYHVSETFNGANRAELLHTSNFIMVDWKTCFINTYLLIEHKWDIAKYWTFWFVF